MFVQSKNGRMGAPDRDVHFSIPSEVNSEEDLEAKDGILLKIIQEQQHGGWHGYSSMGVVLLSEW